MAYLASVKQTNKKGESQVFLQQTSHSHQSESFTAKQRAHEHGHKRKQKHGERAYNECVTQKSVHEKRRGQGTIVILVILATRKREKKKPKGGRGILEQMHEIAREDVSPRHAPIFVEQLATPPPVLGRSGDGDDVVRLEIELFRDGRGVVVKRAHYIDDDGAVNIQS
jgi:hypothetical protein